jgi:pyruvate decarboxylase
MMLLIGYKLMMFFCWQMTAQDVSTMIRCGQKTIVFLINNGGYTIEVEIHDGPYNVIKNWNYTGLVDAIHNGHGKCWTTKVSLCL